MAPNLAKLNAHTLAFIDLMQPGLVGDGEAPDGAGWQALPGQSTFVGYGVCYPISTSFDGSIAEGQDDAELTWQVTCVGATRAQAEAVADLVIASVVGEQLTVAGRAMSNHIELQDGSGGARRDESETQPPLWFSTPRFTVTSTPA